MLNGIDKMDRADFWDLGHDMSSFFSRLEGAHLSIIDLMLALDGLDFSYVDEIAAYDFSKYYQRDDSDSSDDDSDDSA